MFILLFQEEDTCISSFLVILHIRRDIRREYVHDIFTLITSKTLLLSIIRLEPRILLHTF